MDFKDPLFKDAMTKVSVQNRYLLSPEKYQVRMKREAKASRTSPSFSELDRLIEECLEVEKLEQDLRQKDGMEVCLDFCFHFSGAS